MFIEVFRFLCYDIWDVAVQTGHKHLLFGVQESFQVPLCTCEDTEQLQKMKGEIKIVKKKQKETLSSVPFSV